MIAATAAGRLFIKKAGKDSKEFKPLEIAGLDQFETLSPRGLRYVAGFNVMVEVRDVAHSQRRGRHLSDHRDQNDQLHH